VETTEMAFAKPRLKEQPLWLGLIHCVTPPLQQ